MAENDSIGMIEKFRFFDKDFEIQEMERRPAAMYRERSLGGTHRTGEGHN